MKIPFNKIGRAVIKAFPKTKKAVGLARSLRDSAYLKYTKKGRMLTDEIESQVPLRKGYAIKLLKQHPGFVRGARANPEIDARGYAEQVGAESSRRALAAGRKVRSAPKGSSAYNAPFNKGVLTTLNHPFTKDGVDTSGRYFRVSRNIRNNLENRFMPFEDEARVGKAFVGGAAIGASGMGLSAYHLAKKKNRR